MVTLAMLAIGLHFLVVTLVPPEYIAEIIELITGGSVSVAVMYEPVNILDFASYVIPLVLLYVWGIIKKKRSVTFWLKIAAITMVIIAILLFNMVLGPLYCQRLTGG